MSSVDRMLMSSKDKICNRFEPIAKFVRTIRPKPIIRVVNYSHRYVCRFYVGWNNLRWKNKRSRLLVQLRDGGCVATTKGHHFTFSFKSVLGVKSSVSCFLSARNLF